MTQKHLLSTLHWSVTLVGFGLLVYSIGSLTVTSLSLWTILGVALALAVLVFFPVEIFQGEIYLLNAIVLPAGFLFGISQVAPAIFIGLLGAFLFIKSFLIFQYRSGAHWTAKGNSWSRAGFLAGSLIIPLSIFSFISTGMIAANPNIRISDGLLQSFLTASVIFCLLHAGLVLLEHVIEHGKARLQQANDLIAFIILEFLPIPFVLFASLAVLSNEPWIAAVLVAFIVIPVAIGINRLSVPRSLLERRARELSSLSQISQTLSSSLDLEKVLVAIQIQVTQVLDVNNFYVALLDSNEQEIWYPLAVKDGQRQAWARRPLTDRLTDRVITLREPILLAHHARQELAKIGLPPSEDAPYAWVGVPLIISERVIGCMAVFSLSPDSEFTKADLNLLTILAGQASVAIEIALHNALLSSDVTIGRDRLSAVLNSVNEGIVLIEGDGRVTLVNEAASHITRIPQSDFLGRGLSELATPILLSLGFSSQQAIMLMSGLKNPSEDLEYASTYHLSERVPPQVIERTLVPVTSKPGEFTGWLIVLRDITEEQQIKEARDLISETLVHDLRSPIGAVLSALDVVTETFDSGGSQEVISASVNIARRSARWVLELVESMLEIARLQSGNFTLDVEPVSIKPLVAHAILEFNLQASDFGIRLDNRIPDNLEPVMIDSGKIQRVLNNLIDNALKFTPERGDVYLDARPADNTSLMVRVVDNGPGIPEEYREKIFERFHQVPGRTARRRGSGLGLAYCRLAVEAHGGEIWVESNVPQGSIFCFTLPLGSQADTSPTPQEKN